MRSFLLIAAATAFSASNGLAQSLPPSLSWLPTALGERKAAHHSPRTAPGRNQRSQAVLAYAYDVSLETTQLGRPALVERQAYSDGVFANQYEAHLSYDAAGRVAVITYTDSGQTAVHERMTHTYTAGGKLQELTVEGEVTPGTLTTIAREVYLFDSRDSVRGLDFYTLDAGSGVLGLSSGNHYNDTYDAQGRLTTHIDSVYVAEQGQYVADAKEEYAYSGTGRGPVTITVSDTSNGSFEAQGRIANVVYVNYERGWIASADIQIPAGPLGFFTAGNMAGTLSGDTFTLTTSTIDLNNPTGPPSPVLRITTAYNTQGDQTLAQTEAKTVNDTLDLVGRDEYAYEYARSGSISVRTESSLDMSGVVTPVTRYLYLGTGVTAVRAGQGLAFSLAPNPATGQVRLSGAGTAATAELISATGQSLRRLALRQGQAAISLEGLAPGIYQVRLEGGAAQRLIVR